MAHFNSSLATQNFTMANETNSSFAYCPRTTSIETIKHILNWSSFAVAASGVSGNTLCIVLMLISSCCLKKPFNSYLFTAYTCDVNFLLCLGLQCVRPRNSLFLDWLPCHRLIYLSHVLSFVSQWCLWAASTKRYLAVSQPLRYAYHRSRICSIIGVLGFFSLAFVLESWILVFLETDPQDSAKCDYRFERKIIDFWFPIFHGLEAGFAYVLPGLMMFACTIGVRRVLRRYNFGDRNKNEDSKISFRRLSLSSLVENSKNASENRRRLNENEDQTNGYIIVSTVKRRSQEKKEREVVSILLLIAIIDATLNLQNYIVRASTTVMGDESWSIFGCLLRWDIVQAVSQLLYYCQFILNVVYWLAFPYARGAFMGKEANKNKREKSLPRRKSPSETTTVSIPMTTCDATSIRSKTSKKN